MSVFTRRLTEREWRAATGFRDGQRVKLTEAAIEQGLKGYAKTIYGTVRGYTNSPLGVKVQRDGMKGVSHYHVDFWEPAR
jgi:hypothetical protein